jgi:hypothetical protein
LNIDRSPDTTGLIRPFIIKDGTRIGMRTTTNADYASNYQVGDTIYGAYPLTSSVSKEYYTAATLRTVAAVISSSAVGKTVLSSGSVTHLYAIKNILNYYQYISPHYAVSSSILGRDLMASSGPGATRVGLISIPSIFYGSQIKKGSVDLQFYYTGTLIAQAKDRDRNGVLYDVHPQSPASGTAIGVTLYNEGFIILTSSMTLNASTDNYIGLGLQNPAWIYFAQSLSGTILAPNSTFIMNMSGTTKIQNITLFATAPKAELNHSNNPTFVSYGSSSQSSRSPWAYLQNDQKTIKNIVSSSYNDPTGSFEKTTYISKIGIYDKNKNLIAIAKPATPVRKTATRDFTFKLKLDI